VLKNNTAGSAATATATKLSSNGVGIHHDGWHTISVYYGKKDSIKAQDAPARSKKNVMDGSQAKQDDIISSLVSLYHDNESSGSTTSTNSNNNEKLYFVDLASNDAISLSNTFKLEQQGWDGLCIEPNPVYWFRLAHRNCTVAGAFVGGREDLQEVEVSLSNKEVGGIVGGEFDNNGRGSSSKTEKRFTVSIQSLFETFHVPSTIDYLSLDVEGAEELIMKDFPFDNYTIHFATIERPNLKLQSLMKEHNYHFVIQLVSWGETLWVHGSILEKMSLSLEEVKKHALRAMGVQVQVQGGGGGGGEGEGEDIVDWPPSNWKGARHFDIEAGYYTN